MKFVPTLATVLIGVGLAACGDMHGAVDAAAGSSQSDLNPVLETGTGMPDLGAQDVAFLEQLATNGISESSVVGLGARRANQPTLRAMSQTWMQQQRQLQDAIMDLARQRRVTLPTEQDVTGAAQYATLSALEGAAFDAQFVAAQGQLLQTALLILQNAAAASPDALLRQWAAAWVPVAQERVTALQSLSTR